MSNAPKKELRFSVNGMELAAQSWGNGQGLPVLALHGWLDNSASFDFLAPHLQGLNLVALDMAGHGRSGHRPGQGAYSFWDDIQDIFSAADELGWDKFFLLGHSRGAIISALAAASFPERILGLALIEGLMPEPARAQDAPQQLANALKGLKAQLAKSRTLYPNLELAISARERGMFPLSRPAAEAITMRGVKQEAGGYCWASDPRLLAPSPVKLSREQIDVFIQGVVSPNLLLLADKGLPQIYPNYLHELKRFTQINYQLLEGGHHLHMEQQAPLVATKIQQFFDGLR